MIQKYRLTTYLVFAVFVAAVIQVAPAKADFHENEINEIMAGLNGDTNIQFIELKMLGDIQNCQGTGHHPFFGDLPDNTIPPCATTGAGARLVFSNAVGTQTAEFIFPHNTSVGQFGRTVLIATQHAVDLGIVPQPDFIMPPNIIVPDSGKVCYKDRGAFFGVIACVAYGNFTGTLESTGIAPALPISGNQSLRRVNESFDNSVAFALGTPTPRNNAGECNVCPIANAQNVVTTEDTLIDISLTGTDPQSLPLTFSIVSFPFRGTFGATTPPNLTYTPFSNAFGSDSFRFKVNNGITDSVTATVSITVTAVNDPPVVSNQSRTLVEGRSIFVFLNANDPEGTFPLIFSVSSPSHGTLSGAPPNLTYKADSGFVGPDSFTFTASDGLLESNPATVSINIIADHPPVAFSQSLTMTENKTASIFLGGSDPDFDRLTFSIVTLPAHGTLGGTVPSITYTPDPDFIGSDSFTFKANDSEFDSVPATVSITVIANRPPTAFPQTLSTGPNIPVVIVLRGADSDLDALTFSIVTPPTNGSLSGVPPNVTYMPNSGFSGADSFTFKANDGKLDSAPATISVTTCFGNAIAFGETKAGDLSNTDCVAPHRSGSFADLYTFSGVAGQLVRISMSSNFGPMLILQNPSGGVLTSSSFCSGFSGNACIPFDANFGSVLTLPVSGTYAIEATSGGSGLTGTYTLNLSLVPQVMLTVNKAGSGRGTVTSSPFGLISCGTDCSESFISGRGITLLANADSGFLFGGWSGGGCSGTGSSCFVTVNSDTTVTATFTPLVFIATGSPNGGAVWRIGSPQAINWTSHGISGNVNVQLSRDGGGTWKTIIKNTPNDGLQNWKVAKPATKQARIRVCSVNSPSTCGMNSSNFTIQK
jgi:hypothetical protein